MLIFSCAHLPSICLWWSACSNLLLILSLGICSLTKFWEFFIYSRHRFFLRYVICKYYLLCITCLIFSSVFRGVEVLNFEVQFIIFSQIPFIRLRNFPEFTESFFEIRSGCWILSHSFSTNMVFFIFLKYELHWFFLTECHLIFWMENFIQIRWQQMSHHIPPYPQLSFTHL